MKALVVGDPHITPEEIGDGDRLIALVSGVLQQGQHDVLVILGDLNHTHALVRIEVMEFWNRSIRHLLGLDGWKGRIRLLVGNHDRSHDRSVLGHSLHYGSNPRLVVVDSPVVDIEADGTHVAYMPWYPTSEEFHEKNLDLSAEIPNKVPHTLFCHQTFQGSRYENGFWAPEGADPLKTYALNIISGHIHTQQSICSSPRVWYPGSPRWRSVSDANLEKAIYTVVMSGESDLAIVPHSTTGVCRQRIHLHDSEQAPAAIPEALQRPFLFTVDLSGTQAYIDARKPLWEAAGASVRSFPEKTARLAIRESEGIQLALSKYVENFHSPMGTSLEVLKGMVAERVNV